LAPLPYHFKVGEQLPLAKSSWQSRIGYLVFVELGFYFFSLNSLVFCFLFGLAKLEACYFCFWWFFWCLFQLLAFRYLIVKEQKGQKTFILPLGKIFNSLLFLTFQFSISFL